MHHIKNTYIYQYIKEKKLKPYSMLKCSLETFAFSLLVSGQSGPSNFYPSA